MNNEAKWFNLLISGLAFDISCFILFISKCSNYLYRYADTLQMTKETTAVLEDSWKTRVYS